MGRFAARFVVDTHCHAQRAVARFAERGIDQPSAGEMYADVAELVWFDNTDRLFYDMERYGVDLCIIQSGGLARGMDNDLDAELAERFPDRIAALCYPTTLQNKSARGEAKWSFEAALAETAKRLESGKYCGIGQGLPLTEGESFARLFAEGEDKKKIVPVSPAEELDRARACLDLARKHAVAVAGLPHDKGLTGRLAAEYPDVPIVLQLVGWGRRASTEQVRQVCEIAGPAGNVYLEMGLAPAELYEIALSDPNVGPTKIIFGTDWGAAHYVHSQPGRPIRGENFTSYVDWIGKYGVARYQSDFWGWSLHQIDKLRDTLTQDEINLMIGGNATRIFKLDVPYTRLFPEGRPDLWGVDWEKSIPFIPRDQIPSARKEKKTKPGKGKKNKNTK